jgi:hypothetical protein
MLEYQAQMMMETALESMVEALKIQVYMAKAKVLAQVYMARARPEKVCEALVIVLMVGSSVSMTGRETEVPVVVVTAGGLKVAKEKVCVDGQKIQTTEELLV